MLEPTTVHESRSDIKIISEFKAPKEQRRQELWQIGPGAAQVYHAVNFQGLHYPEGTGPDLVHDKLQIPQGSVPNTDFQATVEGLNVRLDCQVLPIKNGTETSLPGKSVLTTSFVADVDIPGCKIKGVTLAAGPDRNFYHKPDATQNYQAQIGVYPCNVDWDFSKKEVKPDDDLAKKLVLEPHLDQRLFLSVTDLQFAKFDKSLNKPKFMFVNKVNAVLCKPIYDMDQYSASAPRAKDGAAQAKKIAAATEPDFAKEMQKFPRGALALAVKSTTDAWELGTGGDDFVLSETVPTFFQLMTLTAKKSGLADFMDSKELINVGTTVFQGVGVQALGLVMRWPTDKNIDGKIMFKEYRLRATLPITIIILVFLVASAGSALALIWLRPKSVAPHRPGSIGASAALLVTSPALRDVLGGSDMTTQRLRERTQGMFFKRILTPAPNTVYAVDSLRTQEGMGAGNKSGSGKPWWHPVSGSIWFVVLLVVLSLGVIASLEAVQQLSDRESGFIRVGHTDLSVFMTIVPATVMVIIAGMYASIGMIIAVFAPYNALKKAKAPAKRSLTLNLSARFLPGAIFHSFKVKHIAAGLALLASFLGLWLSVFASSLYVVKEVTQEERPKIHQVDKFDFENVNLALDDKQAGSIAALMGYNTLNYTNWAHEDLVFNSFKLSGSDIDSNSEEPSLRATVKATRPSLSCKTVPSSQREISLVESDQDPSKLRMLPGQSSSWTPVPGFMAIGFKTSMKYSDWCEEPPSKGSDSASWMQYYMVPNDTSTSFIGKASIMLWKDGNLLGDGSVDTTPAKDSDPSNLLRANDHGCPTFAVTLGKLSTTKQGNSGDVGSWGFEQDLATIVCYQNLEEVEAEVNWHVPDFTLDSRKPPVADDSTAKKLKTARGSERFPFSLNTWLDGLVDPVFNRTIPGPSGEQFNDNELDDFISAMVFSKDGRPVDQLQGEHNVKNLQAMSTKLYQRYMTQAISLNMRKDVDKNSNPQEVESHLIQVVTLRLVQDMPTKLAIQITLGLMTILIIVARSMTRIRSLLPYNTFTIAGSAALLVGSELVQSGTIPENAVWMSEKKLERSVFGHGLYSLRWWLKGDEVAGKRRYGVDEDVNYSA